jgi:hypothetical protein
MVGGALVHPIHSRHIECSWGSGSSTEIRPKWHISRNRLLLRIPSCIMPLDRPSGEDPREGRLVVGSPRSQ